MGVYNILYMIERGELSEDLREKSLVTYVAGLFRSIRFMTITRPGVDVDKVKPKNGLSTPYRLTIRNIARLVHHVFFNMGDLLWSFLH